MARKKKETKWDSAVHAAALQKGFAELDWDPELTDGKEINTTIKSDPEIFEILQPFFSVAQGGEKGNNNQIYAHYKTQGGEFFTKKARAGIRHTPSTAYLDNQGVSGERKRAHEAEASTEGSPSSVSVSLGSTDTSPGTRTMPPKAKPTAPASAAKAKPAPAASSTAKPPKEVDVEFIAHMMDKMKVTGAEERGWDFNCPHPYFWWTYTYSGVKYVRIEVLCWTAPPTDAVPKISADGKSFYFSLKIPSRFTDMFRQFIYYGGELDGTPETCADSIYQQGVACQNKIAEEFNMEEPKPLIKVDLPFVCAQEFEDPYCDRAGEPPYKLGAYPHEASTANSKAFFYVFSASLKAAAVPRRKATPINKLFTDWQQPGSAASQNQNMNP